MRLVIAEDGVLLREGLSQLLTRAGHTVVAAAEDAPELMRAVAEHTPDLVIADIRMPPDSRNAGLRAAIEIRRTYPGVAVLLLSQYLHREYVADLLSAKSASGVGYLLKERVGDLQEFLAALDRLARGATVVDSEVVQHLLSRHERTRPLDRLTPRESEVLGLVAQGRSNLAIARSLHVTEDAVAKHVNSIFTKLDLAQANDQNRRVVAVLNYLGIPLVSSAET